MWRHNKDAIIDTLRPNHDKAAAMTAMKRFRWKWIAVNPLYTVVFGMTKHQTVEQNRKNLAFGRILQFQRPEENSYLKNNTYNKYKPYNTKSFKILVLSFFCEHCYCCLQVSNKSQQTPWRRTWPLGQEHSKQYDMNGVYSCRDYEINIRYCINQHNSYNWYNWYNSSNMCVSKCHNWYNTNKCYNRYNMSIIGIIKK